MDLISPFSGYLSTSYKRNNDTCSLIDRSTARWEEKQRKRKENN